MVTRSLCLAFVVSVGLARAQEAPPPAEPIRFARHPALSPDGKRLAFSYKGDIWTVASSGGSASRVTVHEAHDQLPQWSPDGRWLAFSSKRAGGYDVWLIPSEGGSPRQLTHHSADDAVCGWSPDGAEVLFSSARETTRTAAIYAVHVVTGRSRLVREDDVALANARFAPDGASIACTRGGSWMRRGYRGSGRSGLICFPSAGGAGRWLVRDGANQRWPLFIRSGQALLYVSDRSGSPNLVSRALSGGRETPVTRFTAGNVTYPTTSADGRLAVFEHEFDLWSVSLTAGGRASGAPRLLSVAAPSDDRTNPVRREAFAAGFQELALAPDGKQLALVVHGEVFVQSMGAPEARRITDTPQREEDVAWSPDGKQLAFISDRSGAPDLYAHVVGAKEPVRLTNTATMSEQSPAYPPDGKSISFIRGGSTLELCVMPSSGGAARVLLRDAGIEDVRWSPDGKWMAYTRARSHSAGSVADVHVMNVETGSETNVTRYPGVNRLPVWSQDGKRLYWLSDRTTNTHIYSVDLLDPRAAEDDADAAKQPAPASGARPSSAAVTVRIDLEEIHKRPRQITTGESSVSAYALSPDGKTLVFVMSQLGRPDIWKVASEGGTPVRLTQTGEAASRMQFSPDGASVMYLAGGQAKAVPIAGPVPAPLPVPLSARMDVDVAAEMTQLFDEAWRKMRDGFYDPKMHGCDWDGVRARYRPVVHNLTYKEDFYALFNLALGELNASHTGISGPREVEAVATASLGVAFDDGFPGPGLKVRSVMAKGPADRDRSRLRPGDVILQIDGVEPASNEDAFRLLTGRAGKRVELILGAGSGAAKGEGKSGQSATVVIRAITPAACRQLEYERWVKEREGLVDRLSARRLAYVHLAGMGAANLEAFRRMALGDAEQKRGLVLDLRFNGGGSVADEMFSILNNRVFGYRLIRGDEGFVPAPMPAFTRPVIVLANEASFSNAEVFPWGFRALKLGKIVGVPTFGGVIGTGGTNLIDGSSLRMPAVGSYTIDCANMENNGCPPDILVEHTLDDIQAKHDRQLEIAVAELLTTVGRQRQVVPRSLPDQGARRPRPRGRAR